MYFAAVIAAALALDSADKALETGLDYIPRECALRDDLLWAMEKRASIGSYREARAAVDERFAGMGGVHTNNNACLVVFGLKLGHGDVGETIAQTVAMGLDNDCTGATAGSISGAVAGKSGIDPHWYGSFENSVLSYINGHPKFAIDDLVDRFTAMAKRGYR